MRKEIFNNLIIFEMANNHQGKLEHGLRIVKELNNAWNDVCKNSGLRKMIKFQYRNLDTFIHPRYRDYEKNKHIKRFIETRLTDKEFKELAGYARSLGFITGASVFDEASLCKINENKIDFIKIASCSSADWPLLEEVARLKKPVISSLAGREIKEVDNIVSFFVHRNINFALMHCVGLYPVDKDKLSLSRIDFLRNRYPFVPIGYSGHEEPENLDAVKVAISKGAQVLERHVGVKTKSVKLNKYSLNPIQVRSWLKVIVETRRMCGSFDYKPSKNEIESLNSLRRGVYVKKGIKKGDKILKDNVFFAMPYFQKKMHSGEFKLGVIADRDYRNLSPIRPFRQIGLANIIYTAIHEAKSLLYEARIFLRGDFKVELSHHYGIDKFRDIGALIINVINREYCKKLLVMVAKQRHPSHCHKVKEESFQVLHGDLTLDIEGKKKHLKAGDIITIERGKWHNFYTKRGVVFEEISTTHMKDDSFYDDERIYTEPNLRKTPIGNW